jgi:flagellar motor switch protein FliM
MNKILSQEEIDALLSTVAKGDSSTPGAGGEPRRLQLYDFKHPERISKEQIRTLRTIHDNFARLFGTHLSTTLRTMVDVNLLSIDQVTFSEYTMSLSVPAAIYTFRLNALDGKAILEVSPQFILFVVDRMLGGYGDANHPSREITVVEQNVVSRIIATIISILNEVWTQVHPLQASLESFESDPQFVQIARASESLAIIFFEIRVRGAAFTMNFGVPYFVLEPILNKLSAQSMMALAGKREKEAGPTAVRDRLMASKLQLRALLAETVLSVRDFIDLQPDDIIQVDHRTTQPVSIVVGERAKYFGSGGQLGRRRAVKIIRAIEQEEEVMYE